MSFGLNFSASRFEHNWYKSKRSSNFSYFKMPQLIGVTFEWAIEEQSWKVVIEILVPEKADFDHNIKINYYVVRLMLTNH